MTSPDLVPPDADGRKVVYSRTEVIAYFDAMGKNVEPAFATYAKVWSKDGNMQVVALERD